MTPPKGIRIRADQMSKADKYLAKSGYEYADYIRAAVDLLQKQKVSVIDAQLSETAFLNKKARAA